MKLFFPAAVFLTVSTGALAIPFAHSPSHNVADGHAVAGTTVTDGTSVYLSIPCPGCFTDSTDEIDVELKVEPSTQFCHCAGLTLNNAKLDTTQSTILFKTNASDEPNAYVVAADVDHVCLGSRVTLLTLRVNEIFGQLKVPSNTGFSISFEQGPLPKILRFEHTPVNSGFDIGDADQWTKTKENPDVVVIASPPIIDNKLPNQVQEELRRLHEIKARIGRLVHQHMRQERRILQLIKNDFNVCTGARCYLQTAIAKVPDLFELAKAHFRHRPDWSKLQGHEYRGFAHPQQVPELMGSESSDQRGDVPTQHGGDMHKPLPLNDHVFAHDLHDELDPEDFPPPPPPPLPFDEQDQSNRHHEDHTPVLHPHINNDSPPTPPSGSHEHHHHPPPPCHRHAQPADRHNGHGTPRHCRPHFLHPHGPHRHPFFFSAGTLVVVAIVASLFFKCARAHTGLFRNSRRRRDCAARREECRNRAAYRRAAMRHKWRQWWSQFRRPEGTADYEEKRARILNQEDALEDVMQGEIRELRRAHEIVGDMMRAEESRQRLYHEANFGSASEPSSSASRVQGQYTSNLATEATLPLYQPPPPSYDQELEGELTVVDGFSYTPSATDSTPDSSVIDCNSRMSFDTDTTVTK